MKLLRLIVSIVTSRAHGTWTGTFRYARSHHTHRFLDAFGTALTTVRVTYQQVEHFSLQDLTLSAAPSNFKAKLELEATVNAEKSPVSLNPDPIELFRFPIPGVGIAIKGIFSLGATVSYDVGTSATFAGTATADFGLEASLPDGAKVSADIMNPDQSSATGWGGSSLDPIFEVTKIEASIKLSAYSQPKVEFGIKLDNVGDVEVAVAMKLPEISSTLAADYGISLLGVSHLPPLSPYIPYPPFHLKSSTTVPNPNQ